ncbi:glutathione S-transferase [Neisseria sp. Ec49-e6-T10]|uniref:glutathione S-transferase n=1 Tax=Neisseria sp. Ec49-e6-T10 TaxID=3140744 RepID=UPI003EBED9E0
MITLHHLNNSRSQRILWLLEELGLSYTIKYYQRNPKTLLAPESLKSIHPLGKSPVLTDGAVTVAESGAIIEYLIDQYDTKQQFRPTLGSAQYLAYRYWLHYAEGSLMPLLLMRLVFDRLGGAPMPWLLRPISKAIGKGVQKAYIDQQLAIHLNFIEQHLAQNNWFALDQFSAADIQMSFPLEAIATQIQTDGKIRQFLNTIHQRDAYKRALLKENNDE